MLKAEFIQSRILRARDARLAYLAIHNHGGIDSVGFSPDDMASHERGYPALLDIARGMPVGAWSLHDLRWPGICGFPVATAPLWAMQRSLVIVDSCCSQCPRRRLR